MEDRQREATELASRVTTARPRRLTPHGRLEKRTSWPTGMAQLGLEYHSRIWLCSAKIPIYISHIFYVFYLRPMPKPRSIVTHFGVSCYVALHQIHGSRTCGGRARAAHSGRSRGARIRVRLIGRARTVGAAWLRGRARRSSWIGAGVSGPVPSLLGRYRCWVARAPRRIFNGTRQMAVAGLADARKVDLRFGDAARQVQNIGAAVHTGNLDAPTPRPRRRAPRPP